MAFQRRSGQRFVANVWPGFVDAMTALLLVLMFVLSIFMIVQFVLSETISDQDTELTELGAQVVSLAQALGLEQRRAIDLEDEVASLTANLDTANDERTAQAALIASLRSQSAALEARVASFEQQVASLLADRDNLQAGLDARDAELTTARAELVRVIDEREALQLALAQARDEIDAQAEEARLAAARREALEALVADLQAETAAQETSLAQVLATLEGREAELAAVTGQLAEVKTALSAEEAERLAEAAAAEALRARLAGIEATLSEEEQARLAEAAAAEALRKRLENADAELTAMTLALEEQRKKAEETLTLMAAAQATKADLDTQLAAALAALNEAEETSEAERAEMEARLAAALAAAQESDNNALSLQRELAMALAAKRAAEGSSQEAMTRAEERAMLLAQAEATLAEADAEKLAAQREAALLNAQVRELRSQLNGLQAILDEAAERDAQAQVQLDVLGSQLNAALAQVAAEQRARADLEEAERKRLERYRSEFFGQLRDVLGTREGVTIVGDRFVFSSEVLFSAGQADLQPEGEAQIAQVAAVIRDVADQIPAEIDWILRVDGHTDNIPLGGGGRYRDNWELSQARALSVVRYMIDFLGIPPHRLAATGFGEHRPVTANDSPEARQQNRRIELKFTER